MHPLEKYLIHYKVLGSGNQGFSKLYQAPSDLDKDDLFEDIASCIDRFHIILRIKRIEADKKEELTDTEKLCSCIETNIFSKYGIKEHEQNSDYKTYKLTIYGFRAPEINDNYKIKAAPAKPSPFPYQ